MTPSLPRLAAACITNAAQHHEVTEDAVRAAYRTPGRFTAPPASRRACERAAFYLLTCDGGASTHAQLAKALGVGTSTFEANVSRYRERQRREKNNSTITT